MHATRQIEIVHDGHFNISGALILPEVELPEKNALFQIRSGTMGGDTIFLTRQYRVNLRLFLAITSGMTFIQNIKLYIYVYIGRAI